MKNLYIIGTKGGRSLIATSEEIIQNALDQEKSGIIPRYSFYDYTKKECVTPTGWLVWSSFRYGCGVVYRRKDGKMVICTGVQGDFACC